MIIKVCGMREAENIREIEALGIDMMGFIFWSGSKRFVSKMPVYMPTKVKRVGVFVNENVEKVRRIAEIYELDYVQLHGSESPAYIQSLKSSILNPQFSIIKVIKAFNIADASDFAQTEPYEGMADLFLFDTKGKMVGGNGQKFDWNMLKFYKGNTPYILSGGIGPEDSHKLQSLGLTNHPVGSNINPKCIGIDLNSRFEIAAGIKDIQKIKTFIQSLNRTSL